MDFLMLLMGFLTWSWKLRFIEKFWIKDSFKFKCIGRSVKMYSQSIHGQFTTFSELNNWLKIEIEEQNRNFDGI